MITVVEQAYNWGYLGMARYDAKHRAYKTSVQAGLTSLMVEKFLSKMQKQVIT